MTNLIVFVAASALFDSISTTVQIVVLVLLFSTANPLRTSLGFIVGVTAAYFLCGLVGLGMVGQLNAMIKLLDSVPNQAYYQTQVIIGVFLLLGGPLYWWYYVKSGRQSMENQLLSRLKQMNFWVALILGALISASSFFTAFPYVVTLVKISAAPVGLAGQIGYLAVYNLVYAMPLAVLFVLFLVLRDQILPKMRLHVDRLNVLITILMLFGIGLLLITDSVAFFWFGKPLLENRLLL